MTDYDFLIIGAGTGGMAAAKKAASYSLKVATIEKEKVGGTCLNRGCTPKKLMVYAADFALKESLAGSYGWQECNRQLDWSLLIKSIHQRLDAINNSFIETFKEKGIELIYGEAKFTGDRTVQVKDRQITADKILIAVGGHPIKPDFPGSELAITSRGNVSIRSSTPKASSCWWWVYWGRIFQHDEGFWFGSSVYGPG